MKIINGLAIFGITVFVTSCFDPPEFPTVPEIMFENIQFYDNPDSLVVSIAFKDGNGDLGLSQSELDSPFHAVNYFLENGTGELITLATEPRNANLPPLIKLSDGQNGTLTRFRTRKKAEYSYLPLYNCVSYRYDSVYVSEEDMRIFDTTTFTYKKIQSTDPNVYVVYDTFYYELNPNYFNIEVEFLIKDGQEFKVFDWQEEFCTIAYNQRFPVLSETISGLEGTLHYSMVSGSGGFTVTFSIKTLKLRIQIKDRALNLSNVIETPEFTLDKIRK
jgi:hypothetical protein